MGIIACITVFFCGIISFTSFECGGNGEFERAESAGLYGCFSCINVTVVGSACICALVAMKTLNNSLDRMDEYEILNGCSDAQTVYRQEAAHEELMDNASRIFTNFRMSLTVTCMLLVMCCTGFIFAAKQ